LIENEIKMTKRNKRSIAGILIVMFLMLVDVNNYSLIETVLLCSGGAVLYYLMVSDK